MVSVCTIVVATSEHPDYRDGNTPKSRGGLRSPLHSQNYRVSVIHLVMKNREELCGDVDRVGAPSMI